MTKFLWVAAMLLFLGCGESPVSDKGNNCHTNDEKCFLRQVMAEEPYLGADTITGWCAADATTKDCLFEEEPYTIRVDGEVQEAGNCFYFYDRRGLLQDGAPVLRLCNPQSFSCKCEDACFHFRDVEADEGSAQDLILCAGAIEKMQAQSPFSQQSR